MLIKSIQESLEKLSDVLHQITNYQFNNPCARLSNATIGQHTRHIVEMFQCLIAGQSSGVVNYDQRKRELSLQTDIQNALLAIELILSEITRDDMTLQLTQVLDGERFQMDTTFKRELLYNLEH